MRKLFEIFKVWKFQKRIVAAAIIWGNTVFGFYKCPKKRVFGEEPVFEKKLSLGALIPWFEGYFEFFELDESSGDKND